MLLLRFESNRHFLFFVFGQKEFYYQERGSTPSEVKKNNSHHHHYNHLSVWLRSIMTSLCLLVILFYFFFLLSRWLSPYSRVRLFALWEFQIVSDFFFFQYEFFSMLNFSCVMIMMLICVAIDEPVANRRHSLIQLIFFPL